MQFTAGYHQPTMFAEADTDGAPLFAQETTPAEKRRDAKEQAMREKIVQDHAKLRSQPFVDNWTLRDAEIAAERMTTR